MEIKIRNAEETDFSQIINLFEEFATFEKLPQPMSYSKTDHASNYPAFPGQLISTP
ncbi:MAG: hypothetical protein AB2L24_16775 [Mangrovibacterium sp.]